jgi:hypothetical protein
MDPRGFLGAIALDEDGAVILRCPICSGEYNHVVRCGTLFGSDKDEASEIQGVEIIGTTEERRSALRIDVECENGHLWSITIQQYKGTEYLQAEARAVEGMIQT